MDCCSNIFVLKQIVLIYSPFVTFKKINNGTLLKWVRLCLVQESDIPTVTCGTLLCHVRAPAPPWSLAASQRVPYGCDVTMKDRYNAVLSHRTARHFITATFIFMLMNIISMVSLAFRSNNIIICFFLHSFLLILCTLMWGSHRLEVNIWIIFNSTWN